MLDSLPILSTTKQRAWDRRVVFSKSHDAGNLAGKL